MVKGKRKNGKDDIESTHIYDLGQRDVDFLNMKVFFQQQKFLARG
jgi:hypothetical protein